MQSWIFAAGSGTVELVSEGSEAIGRLITLMVHDLRNPIAMLGANLSYLKSSELTVAPEDEADLAEALQDMSSGVAELMKGLEHLAWIGRWLSGTDAVSPPDGDVAIALDSMLAKSRRQVQVTLEIDERPLNARGGGFAGRLVEILLANAERYARAGSVTIRAHREAEFVMVEVRDSGSPVAHELREHVFTLEGQSDLKGRSEGRYARFGGLLALRLAVETVGGRVEAGGEKGAASFRLLLPAL